MYDTSVAVGYKKHLAQRTYVKGKLNRYLVFKKGFERIAWTKEWFWD